MNELNKQSTRMISFLNIYMFCKCFVSALQEPLRHEIPHCGYNTEFSSLGKLYSAAKALEEVAQYDIGMRAEAHVSAPPQNKRQALVNAIRTQSRPNNNVQARNIPCLPPNIQGDNAQVHPHPQGMSGQVRMGGNNPHPQGNNNPPTGARPMGTLGQAHNNVVCYKCGQAGHIKPNCLQLRDRQQVAGACIEEILPEENLDDTGEPSPVPLVVNDDPPQVDTGPHERDGEERVAIHCGLGLPVIPLSLG